MIDSDSEFILGTDVSSLAALSSRYHYILVGGGSAGATLASRLSEDPWHSVLLIEAGRGKIPMYDVPSSATFPFWPDNYYYETEKQSFNCLGYQGEVSIRSL